MKVKTKKDYRTRRHLRIRNRVRGTAERPRMSVYRSNRQLYVQFIDDEAGKTLAAASSGRLEEGSKGLTVESAEKLGKLAAEEAVKKGISQIVFDRGGFTYGGRFKALADAARAAGLVF